MRSGRGGAGARAVVVGLAALAGARCVGDVFAPPTSSVTYAFTSPLRDSVVNVGDTTPPLVCRLTADERDVPCRLGFGFSGDRVVSQLSERLVVAVPAGIPQAGGTVGYALGTATVELRPLHVQLVPDTIVRVVRLRAVVPRVLLGTSGGEDTLAVGDERQYIALAATRSGRPIGGAQFQWVQDSGATVAALVPGVDGRVRALGAGVAVFRVVTDTATARVRVRVVGGP